MSPVWSANGPLADVDLLRAVAVVAGLLLARPALAAVAAVLSALPGHAGGVAARVAAAVRPGLARRVLAALLGLGLPAASASGAFAHPLPPSASAATAPARATPLAGTAYLRSPTPSVLGSGELVVVRPGDTLWAIAAAHLPSGAGDTDVARAWPLWWDANRAVIGPDPGLLLPGTRLRRPGAAPAPSRTPGAGTHHPRSAGTPTVAHHRPPAGVDDDARARSLDPDRR